jgi:uncharacterized protein (TIGR03000 family)
MFRTIPSLGRWLLLTGALLFVTAGPSLAGPHGGVGHAHAHFGGIPVGVGVGINHAGVFFPGHFGVRGYPYYAPAYGYRSYRPYPYSYGLGYSPFNATLYSIPSWYFVNPYAAALPLYLGSSGPGPLPPAEMREDTTAIVTVKLPVDAELWFEGTKTKETGSVREFQSPPLTPGRRYTYDVQARWEENGKMVTQSQTVGVSAGSAVTVEFPVPPKPKDKEPPPKEKP